MDNRMIDDNIFRKEDQLIGLLAQWYGDGGMRSFIDGDRQGSSFFSNCGMKCLDSC